MTEKSFNHLPEPEITPDNDTLRLVLSDIVAEAMHYDIELHIGDRLAAENTQRQFDDLSGAELDQAIADLSASTMRDAMEFQRHEGVKQGMQIIADRVQARLEQADN